MSLLIAGLDKQKFDPIVALPDSAGNEPVNELLTAAGASQVIEDSRIKPFHGSTIAPCHSLKDKVSAILSSKKLALVTRQLVKTHCPDIIHLNSTCLVAAAKAARNINPNIPVIAHVREPLLQNWWGRWLASKNLKHIDHFISIDKAGIESISRNLVPNCDIIYNFVDRAVYRSDPERAKCKREQVGVSKGRIAFLYLSRVSPSNGALELVQQVERVKEKLDPSALFLIAGFHERRCQYSQNVSNLIAQSEECIELPFDPDPIALLDAADCVIAPYIRPHSARCIFEGAAMGKPAVGTEIAHLNELVVNGQTGFLYNRLSDSSFLDAVNGLCDDRRRVRFGRRAFEFARENFDLKTNIARIATVYEKLLRQKCER